MTFEYRSNPLQLASLILRLPFYLFPHPILTVLQTVASAAAVATSLPPSAPASGYNTPGGPSRNALSQDTEMIRHKMRLWGLEWCGICVEEIGRAGISDQKKYVRPFPATLIPDTRCVDISKGICQL